MSKPEKKLFLLDAMALIYRAHFAFSKNPRINSKGLNTGAVLGFTNAMVDIINREKPTHLGVAFDTKAPTFRHIEYKEYKAQREETPEDIVVSIPLVKQLCAAWNVPVLELDGYEADDIIGTFAKRASQEGFEVFMMTPDKDYGQLVEEHVYLYKPAYMGNAIDVLGVPEVLAKWDIERVDQVIDMLGLQGDASDNIPGIPGIGPKTASKLLKLYGSVEGLLENTDKLKGKQKEKVEANREQALLSKRLATIVCDVPLEFSEEQLHYGGPNKEVLSEFFKEMEFRTLARRVLGEEGAPAASKASNTGSTRTTAKAKASGSDGQLDMFSAPAANGANSATNGPNEDAQGIPMPPRDVTLPDRRTLHGTVHQYHLIDTPELRQSLVQYLLLQEEICFDTETDSLEAHEAKLVGLAFSYLPGEAYYVPVPENQSEAQAIVEEFRPVLEHDTITLIGQNLKYDLQVMANYCIQLAPPLWDTMLAHYLIEPDGKHNMDVLAENYLNYKPVSITELIGKKGKKQGTMRDVPVEEVAEYAGEDADITLQLKHTFAPQLENIAAVHQLFQSVEVPLVPVLASMERTGVTIDTEALAASSKELAEEAARIQEEIFALAGQEFNVASPKQLGEILFDKLKLVEKPKKTKTGQYATGEEVLVQLAGKHPLPQKILDFRELQKLKSTYVDALPELISQQDGRVHTSYNQAVAATGRLSSTNPNLQNIPVRTARGREIRKAFVPRGEEFIIMAADYSQIELRIMAAFSGDEHMIEAFQNGRDIHATTAAKIFKVPLEEVTSDMRRKAKTANFGIIYGISAFGLSQRLDIPRKEAAEIIDAYFTEFPAVKAYMDKVINDARELEYVETILGRRRYLRDINSRNVTQRGFAERNAINAPIQGSAADIIKKAMIDIHDWMATATHNGKPLQSKMTMQVHDELVFDVHKEEQDLMKEKVVNLMQNAQELTVPMVVEVGTGTNWLEAH